MSPFSRLVTVGGKPVQVAFDGGRLTSDAGVLVLAEIERRLGLAERPARCIEDPRAPERVSTGWKTLPTALKRMMAAMIELFCDSFAQVPRRIVLDIDDTATGCTASNSCRSSMPTTTAAASCRSTSMRLGAASRWP